MGNTREHDSHGMFINYKRSHKHLAGLIFDYFKNKGVDPFIDEVTLRPDGNYIENMKREIMNAPYFFCLLTEDGLEDLLSPNYQSSIYYMEIEEAVRLEKNIFVFRAPDVSYEKMEQLPETIRDAMKTRNSREIPTNNDDLLSNLDYFFRYIDMDLLNGVINWRKYAGVNANVPLFPRQQMEKGIASFENRFGKQFMDSVRSGEKFTGAYRVKEVNMACYAANMLFTPTRRILDRNAYDLGLMFNAFGALLKDPDFSLRLVIVAPGSAAARDAVNFHRLGNSSFEDTPEGVFLSSFANIHRLMDVEPYQSAARMHRFSVTLTECALPYALCHVIYKNGWEEYNHVKVDLYSLDLDSSMDRRSMIIFEEDNKADYDFFVHQFMYLRRDQFREKSATLIRRKSNDWLRQWEAIRPEEDK